MEKYSVLMSVYYKEKPEYFICSIESILNQTKKPDEIVIVKDGKLTKKLEEVILEFARNYPKMFTIVSIKENGGLGRALNYGLKICRNELVARMDTDDISLPQRCEIQLKEFEKSGRLCICGTQINEFINESTNIISSRQVPLSFEDIKSFARRRSPFNHPTVMYKRSVVLELGGYAEYGRKEDLDLFIRMINLGCYAVNVEEALLLYRTNEENMKRRKTWKNCKEYIIVMYNFFKKGYIGLNDMLFVIIGEMLMYCMPTKIAKGLNNYFMRKKPI